MDRKNLVYINGILVLLLVASSLVAAHDLWLVEDNCDAAGSSFSRYT